MTRPHSSGFVLVTALFLGLLLAAFAGLTLLLTSGLSGATGSRRDSAAARQLAEAGASLVQSRLAEDFARSGLTRDTWLARLALPPTHPLSRHWANRAHPDRQPYLQISPPAAGGDPGRHWNDPGLMRLPAAAPAEVYARLYLPAEEPGVVQVRVTAYLPGTRQTVEARLAGAIEERLELALAARTPNCLFCHLQVHGAVAALTHLRPGFLSKDSRTDIGFDEQSGTEPPGDFADWGDGRRLGLAEDSGPRLDDNWLASAVRGDLYAYQHTTNDKSDLDPTTGEIHRLNGVEIAGETNRRPARVQVRSFASPMHFWRGTDADDNNRFDDFAPLDHSALAARADGRIGGRVQEIAFGDSYIAAPRSVLGPVVKGHAVLLGEAPSPTNATCRTASAPLTLTGDLFVQGDVVIRGCLSGRGRIYSGRNIYVAGDLVLVDPPGVNGNYTTAPDPDAAARADLAAARDALLLVADGAIVLGDYGESLEAGPRLERDRAGARHLRQRFGLGPGVRVPMRLGAGLPEELRTTADGQYRTATGEVVRAEAVRQLEGYEALIRPAPVRPDIPASSPWLSDAQFLALLGEGVPATGAVSTWRIDVRSVRPLGTETVLELARSADPAKRLLCQEFFVANLRFGSGTAAERDAKQRATALIAQLASAQAGWNGPAAAHLSIGSSHDGEAWILEILNRRPAGAGFTYAVNRPAQVQRVDALLYAARRIGGLVNGTNFTLNGGAIAPEIALTAPGVGDAQAVWIGDAGLADRLRTLGQQPNPLSGTRYNYGAVNYDYRLRNGGLTLRFVSRLNVAESLALQTRPPDSAAVCRNARCD